VTPEAEEPLVPIGLDATLVLVRHGETEFIVEGRFQGRAQTPLSATGLDQVALTAERLAQGSVDGRFPPLPIPASEPLEIAHSPLRRTTETAEAIAGAFRAAGRPAPALRPDDGLAEIAQGEWEGLLGAEVESRWGDVLAAWRRDATSAWAPGGESIAEVEARLRPAVRHVLASLAAGRRPMPLERPGVAGYAAPTPADQPWTILVGHDGVFKVALLALLELPAAAFWRFPFVLAGITIVEVRGGRAVLRAHNLADHLASLRVGEIDAQRESAARERSGAL
jgi:broad specificity phosphatase PhoE